MRASVGYLLASALVCSTSAVPEYLSQQPLGHDDNEALKAGLPFSTSALEKYIESSMKKWHALGMAVAIINGNETWAKVSF